MKSFIILDNEHDNTGLGSDDEPLISPEWGDVDMIWVMAVGAGGGGGGAYQGMSGGNPPIYGGGGGGAGEMVITTIYSGFEPGDRIRWDIGTGGKHGSSDSNLPGPMGTGKSKVSPGQNGGSTEVYIGPFIMIQARGGNGGRCTTSVSPPSAKGGEAIYPSGGGGRAGLLEVGSDGNTVKSNGHDGGTGDTVLTGMGGVPGKGQDSNEDREGAGGGGAVPLNMTIDVPGEGDETVVIYGVEEGAASADVISEGGEGGPANPSSAEGSEGKYGGGGGGIAYWECHVDSGRGGDGLAVIRFFSSQAAVLPVAEPPEGGE